MEKSDPTPGVADVEQVARFQEPAPPEYMLKFFKYDHLPPALREVSEKFADLAHWVVANCPRNPERTVALRELMRAKDDAVRSRLP